MQRHPDSSAIVTPSPEIECQELTCPICLHLFRDPISLFCTHALCCECILSLLEAQRQGSGGAQASGGAPKLLCPACGQVTTLPPASLPPINSVLQRRIDMLTGKIAGEPAVCDRCELQPADLFCEHCDMTLCETCHTAHHVGRILKSHKVSPVGLSASLSSVAPFCAKPGHEHFRAELFCECGATLCRMCLQMDDTHRQHRCTTVHAAVEQLLNDVMTWQRGANERREILRTSLMAVDQSCLHIAQHASEEITKIRQTIARLKVELDRLEQEATLSIATNKDQQIKAFSGVKLQTFQAAAALNLYWAQANTAIFRKNFAELSQARQRLLAVSGAPFMNFVPSLPPVLVSNITVNDQAIAQLLSTLFTHSQTSTTIAVSSSQIQAGNHPNSSVQNSSQLTALSASAIADAPVSPASAMQRSTASV